MTEPLYRDDPYLAEAEAVVAAGSEGVELDRTVFTPPGRPTRRHRADRDFSPAARRRSPARSTPRATGCASCTCSPRAPTRRPGRRSASRSTGERRHRLMRMHSALHLLSVVLPYGVTGGGPGRTRGGLDFDMPEPAGERGGAEARLNEYVAADLPIERMDQRGRARGAAGDGQDHEGEAAGRPGAGAAGADRDRRGHPRPAALRRHARARPARSGRSASARSRRRAGRTGGSTCTSPTDTLSGRLNRASGAGGEFRSC